MINYFIKPIFIILLIGFIASSILPTKFKAKEKIKINQSLEITYNYLALLENRKKWFPLLHQDAFIDVKIENKKLKWFSEKLNSKGEEEIKNVGERFVETQQYEKIDKITKKLVYTTFNYAENVVEVSLEQTNQYKIPYNLFVLFKNKKSLDKEVYNNLQVLKNYLEVL